MATLIPPAPDLAAPGLAAPEAPDSPALADSLENAFGVYVHVPFCSHKCGYCDFASWSGIDELHERYTAAVLAEIERARSVTPANPATTVFIGGGTPSRLRAGLLAGILDAIPKAKGAEVTVEANPDSATPAFFDEIAVGGATRVSLGMQSSDATVLRFLEREHNPKALAPAVAAARRAGIRSVNLDLIFGTPGETAKSWDATLQEALGLEPDHLSCYALTVEPATPLGMRVRSKECPKPDDDVLADRYAHSQDILASHGFVQYEVSNWARPGHACRHNLLYWAGGSYAGIGCSAHAHDRSMARRSWNVAAPERYCAALEAGRSPVAGAEDLAPATVASERRQLGLRRTAGIREEILDKVDLGPAEALVERTAGRVRIRPDALFRAGFVLMLV